MVSLESDAVPDDGRSETQNERLDRNWDEILQELRVTQTGSQIITGFLLAVAFQQRFTALDAFQVAVYLGLVILAAITTALGLAPVSIHRALFRQRAKQRVVTLGNRLMKITLVGVGIVIAGTVLLIFDVVVARWAGFVAGGITVLVIVILWVILPRRMRAPSDA